MTHKCSKIKLPSTEAIQTRRSVGANLIKPALLVKFSVMLNHWWDICLNIDQFMMIVSADEATKQERVESLMKSIEE